MIRCLKIPATLGQHLVVEEFGNLCDVGDVVLEHLDQGLGDAGGQSSTWMRHPVRKPFILLGWESTALGMTAGSARKVLRVNMVASRSVASSGILGSGQSRGKSEGQREGELLQSRIESSRL